MAETFAPYAIDRQSVFGMLGDCFEIVMRSVTGQHITEIDEEGNAHWGEGTQEECLKDAEYAMNKVSWHLVELLAHSRATEDVIGADYFNGERFMDYMGRFENYRADFVGQWDAAKTTTEYELGLDTEDPYEEEE